MNSRTYQTAFLSVAAIAAALLVWIYPLMLSLSSRGWTQLIAIFMIGSAITTLIALPAIYAATLRVKQAQTTLTQERKKMASEARRIVKESSELFAEQCQFVREDYRLQQLDAALESQRLELASLKRQLDLDAEILSRERARLNKPKPKAARSGSSANPSKFF